MSAPERIFVQVCTDILGGRIVDAKAHRAGFKTEYQCSNCRVLPYVLEQPKGKRTAKKSAKKAAQKRGRQ